MCIVITSQVLLVLGANDVQGMHVWSACMLIQSNMLTRILDAMFL